MASLSDFILNQVKSAASGNDLDNNVLGGLSDSILNSLKQKATSANGISEITELLSGKSSASSSPVTQLASKIFTSDVATKLGLSPTIANAASSLLPVIIEKVVGAVSSKGGDFDLASVLSALGGNSASSSKLGNLGKIIGGLGKLFGRK